MKLNFLLLFIFSFTMLLGQDIGVIRKDATLRDKPNRKGLKIIDLSKGTKVEIIDLIKAFYKVKVNSKTGFVEIFKVKKITESNPLINKEIDLSRFDKLVLPPLPNGYEVPSQYLKEELEKTRFSIINTGDYLNLDNFSKCSSIKLELNYKEASNTDFLLHCKAILKGFDCNGNMVYYSENRINVSTFHNSEKIFSKNISAVTENLRADISEFDSSLVQKSNDELSAYRKQCKEHIKIIKDSIDNLDRKLDMVEGIWSLNFTKVISNGLVEEKTDHQAVKDVYIMKAEDGNYLYNSICDPDNEAHLLAMKLKENNLVSKDDQQKVILEPTASDRIFNLKLTKKGYSNITCNAFLDIENKVVLTSKFRYPEDWLKELYGQSYIKGIKVIDDMLWIKKYPINDGITSDEANHTFSDWKGNGSGIIIDRKGYLVTNNHVVEGANEIEIEINNKGTISQYSANVISKDKVNDLALLKIKIDDGYDIGEIRYSFNLDVVDTGTDVFALGYPFALNGLGKEVKFTDGTISSRTGLDGDITKYQISVPIQGGNSGGPLFDFEGNLVGINSSKIVSKEIENVGYTIKTAYVKNLLDMSPIKINLPKGSLSGLSLSEKIKILDDYTVLIKTK